MNWKDDSVVNDLLRDKFDQYLPETEVPQDLKKEVFNTVDHLQLASEVFDLFTGKFGQTQVQLISILKYGADK